MLRDIRTADEAKMCSFFPESTRVAMLEKTTGRWVCRAGNRYVIATHIGTSAIGYVGTYAHDPKVIVWKLYDFDGRLLAIGREQSTRSRFGAWRRAIRRLRHAGCDTRVRAGEIGPWGAGAAYV